jgi:hypothetical protein
VISSHRIFALLTYLKTEKEVNPWLGVDVVLIATLIMSNFEK